MSASTRLGAALLALAFLAFHVPYPPASLDDLDSINFAMGVRSFDVADHRPHPPGYPVFIAAANAANLFIASEATAISAVGIAAGTTGVFALVGVFRRLDYEGSLDGSGLWPLLATLLTVTSPLYWFTASRPLSDMAGLVAALGVQALVLTAVSHSVPQPVRENRLMAASFLAAVAVGLRSQVMWLTFPLVRYAIVRDDRVNRFGLAARSGLAAGAGTLVWVVPLVGLTGGVAAYWKALFSQGVEDFSNVQMLWTTPTPRVLASGLYDTLVAPWARWDVASTVLVLAAIGVVRLYREARAALIHLTAAFLPYAAFGLLFQETFTTRYALPIVIPVAYLATHGASRAGSRLGIGILVGLSAFDAHVSGTTLAAYSREKAPAFRLLQDMQTAARATHLTPVLAADRRQALDLRRALEWVGPASPPLAARLATPPKHEWLEAVRYWNDGGRSPVWFVVDPKRAQMDLTDHGEPRRYRWSLPYPIVLGGVRPNEMDWYQVEQPEWYVGEGWALTPESAGVAAEDRRGPGISPIEGWIRRREVPQSIMIGGRNLDSKSSATVSVAVDGQTIDRWTVPPGFFLRTLDVPVFGAGGDYLAVRVAADSAAIAIEQFDAGPKPRVIVGFGDGWQEQEYDATTGARWRWLSAGGQLAVRSDGRPLVLHLEGDAPAKYYPRPSRLIVKAADRTVFDGSLSAGFSLDVPIPADFIGSSDRLITLETDQVFVPAERSRRSGDRRHLGLRIFKCRLGPAS